VDGGIKEHNFAFGTGGLLVAKFKARLLYFQGTLPPHPGSFVGPSAGVDVEENRKLSCPCLESSWSPH